MDGEIYVSAPGKIILFGEHAVVYGKTAVAGAINLRAYTKLSPTNDNKISLELNDLNISKTWDIENFYTIVSELTKLPKFNKFDTDEEIETSREIISKIGRFNEIESHKFDVALQTFCYFISRLIIDKKITLKPFNMSVKFELPASVGLGSSGAYCTSIIYTLFNFFNIPYELEDVVNYGTFGEYFIHGKSSGIDVALSTYGKIASFQYGHKIEILNSNIDFNIIIVNSKIERDTKKLVEMVRKKLENNTLVIENIFEKIDSISKASVEILKNSILTGLNNDDLKLLDKYCFENNNYLLELGLGHEETTKICNILSKYDITGKITGAGGGGCVYGIEIKKMNDHIKDKLYKELEKNGYNYWYCKLGAPGVEKHNVPPPVYFIKFQSNLVKYISFSRIMTGLVGFVGLGNMGAFMVKNLIKNGKKVIVYDLNKKVLEEFKGLGAEVAKHPADITAASKLVVTMVPEGKDVKQTFTADNGLLKNNQGGTLYIDSSTIAQSDVFDIAKIVEKHNSTFVDAPVSGGVTGAQNGTLTFMIGGNKENYDRACDLLKHMGKNLVFCEKLGNGQAAKICNNMLLAIQMIGVSETMNLGIKMGLDAKLLASIINTSTGRCWSSDTYNPVPGVIEGVPSNRDYEGGFGNMLIAKDLGLAQSASTLAKTPTPMGSLAHQIYRILAKDKDYQKKDFGSVYKYLKD